MEGAEVVWRAAIILSMPAPPPTPRRRLAWWISVLFHPFVLIPLLVGFVASRTLPPQRAALVAGVVVVGAILPMVWIVGRRVRSGRWTDFDVSVREQRVGMYPVALGVAGASVMVAVWARSPRPVLLGTVAILALLVLSSVINLRFKVSLHVGFAALTAVSLWPLSRPVAVGAAVVALLVAWSRVELRRHSLAEVIGGALLGALVGVGLVLWPG